MVSVEVRELIMAPLGVVALVVGLAVAVPATPPTPTPHIPVAPAPPPVTPPRQAAPNPPPRILPPQPVRPPDVPHLVAPPSQQRPGYRAATPPTVTPTPPTHRPPPTLLPVPPTRPIPAPLPTQALVMVPRLVGMDLAAARRAIAGAGLTYGGVSEEPVPGTLAGIVLRSSPPAGFLATRNSAVSLVVSADS